MFITKQVLNVVCLLTFAHPYKAANYDNDQRSYLGEHEHVLYPRRKLDIVCVYESEEACKRNKFSSMEKHCEVY